MLTVPNAVTLVRLLCIPIYVVLLARPHRHEWVAAGFLLGGLGATDWVDGQLARRLNQVSTVGKVFDPTVDRLLLVVGAVSIVAVSAIPLWVAVIALVREVLVAGGALYVAARHAGRMDVTLAGKAGTFGLMCALPGFLLGHAPWSAAPVFEDLAWVAAAIGLSFGWYAAVTYIRSARRLLGAGSGSGHERTEVLR